jgi:hypothetical protein
LASQAARLLGSSLVEVNLDLKRTTRSVLPLLVEMGVGDDVVVLDHPEKLATTIVKEEEIIGIIRKKKTKKESGWIVRKWRRVKEEEHHKQDS